MATGKARYSKKSGEEEPTDRPPRSAKRSIAPRHDSVRPVDVGDLLHEIESLRRRLSELSDASRLVSESLELDVVLRNVIDNARSLTGARYGVLLTYEQSGAIQDFITSGFSSAEIERLGALPQGLGLLGYWNATLATRHRPRTRPAITYKEMGKVLNSYLSLKRHPAPAGGIAAHTRRTLICEGVVVIYSKRLLKRAVRRI